MDSFLKELQSAWPLIKQAPWGFLSLAILLLISGWFAGRFTSRERIEILRERLEDYQEKLRVGSPEEAKKRFDDLEERIQQLSPRRLSEQQSASITKALRNTRAVIAIAQDVGVGDGAVFAMSLSSAFREAGWEVQRPTIMGITNPPPTGVALVVSDTQLLDEYEKVVRNALVSAKIEFDIQPGRASRRASTDDLLARAMENDAQ